MPNKEVFKECPSKRSITPNRSLYDSFGEAHRHIAPPTPKIPTEAELTDESYLTPEQVEAVLKDFNRPRSTKQENSSQQPRYEQPCAPGTENQPGQNSKVTNPSSPSVFEFQTRTTDPSSSSSTVSRQKTPDQCHRSSAYLLHPGVENAFIDDSKATNLPAPSASAPRNVETDQFAQDDESSWVSEDDHAFVNFSGSSLHELDNNSNLHDPAGDPFANQHGAADFPNASSFYPDENIASEQDSTDDEFALDRIKLGPQSSPAIGLSPILPPPNTSSHGNQSHQESQSHVDDVVKKQYASDHFEATYLSGENGTQYPIFIDRGVLPPPSIPASQPLSTSRHLSTSLRSVESMSNYDDEPHDISEGRFVGQTKSNDTVSRLNPFHAFSAASSHTSDYQAESAEPEVDKVFLRPQAEKEVSRALRRATGLSQPSSGLIVGRTRPSRSYASQASPCQTRNDQKEESFYHAPAIQPKWKVHKSGIKITVAPSSSANDEVYMEETQPYITLDNTNMATMASSEADERAAEDAHDWQTVTEDRLEVGPLGRVVSGSSIANYSDQHLVHGRREDWWNDPMLSSVIPPGPSTPFPALPATAMARGTKRHQDEWEDIELRDIQPRRGSANSEWECNQSRGSMPEDFRHFANMQGPIRLVPRDYAARRQAIRRASGLEDQTLTGRVLSPSLPPSSLSYQSRYPLTASRKDSTRSLFSLINNPYFDYHGRFVQQELETPFQQPPSEFYSSSLGWRGTAQVGASTASTPALRRKTARRALSPHLYSHEVMARQRAMDAVRHIGGRGTDSELADMAATVRDQPLSEGARRRQATFYIVAMAVSFPVPLFAVAVFWWAADKILLQLTGGECSGLSYHQRRNLRIMMLCGFGLWGLGVIGGLIALVALRP
ncbi:hypothetical protein CCHL11_07821 [Colletotrichum chlorophyti]|uniref:Uncharacterized protein n=1 Tax=Colletotrichum chlorophyti TaxID=708187 RepID=A0A1Q8RR66_9PEZI|nr:hypothetical protein CCHL11_07821 [Colletotrichum chlorophyti]